MKNGILFSFTMCFIFACHNNVLTKTVEPNTSCTTCTDPSSLLTVSTAKGDSTHDGVVWNAVEGAEKYRVQIGADPSCQKNALEPSESSSTIFLIPEDLVAGTYFACISALDKNGDIIAKAAGFSFQIVQSVGTFVINGPLSPVTTRSPILNWTVSKDAVSYDILLSATKDCSNPVQSLKGVTHTSLSLSAMADGNYFACVTALNAAGKTKVADNSPYAFNLTGPVPASFVISGA